MAKIRTRARAVDMLGRQQIAGIQNAISELFKNAHDAYAKKVQIDFFEEDNLLVIRDDGIGMTREDFEGKWLVLGTESKAGEAAKEHYRPPDEPRRTICGEKGIGRLAIALLGKLVLILSKARRENGLEETIMSFIHWGLFELPGLNLDEVEVPVESIKGGLLPDDREVRALQTRLKESISRIAENHPELDFNSILQDIQAFCPDPSDLDAFFKDRNLTECSLLGSGCGTHFYIGPANPIVRIEIAAEETAQDYSFRKHLIGFCNNVFLEEAEASISPAFRRWQPGAVVGEELLDPNLFFTKDDIARADHLISGTVDEYGQFLGDIRVFDETFTKQVIPWRENAGRITQCGRFNLQFGYVMGLKSESKLGPEEYAVIGAKLERLGGIYIYKDRIRVLPYGDNRVDWLDIERRRTLGAGYYFFSYRRLFGAIRISRVENRELHEKAGREGFQQNQAYRELRDILVNLFINIAAEFFRKGGTKAEYFERKKEEHAKLAAALERREKQVASKRKKLEVALGTFFERTKPGLPESEIANLRKLTHAKMDATSKLPDKDQAAAHLVKIEKEAIQRLQGLRDSYAIKKPAGVGLTKALRRDWDAYLTESSRLEAELFRPFSDEIAATLGAVANEARLYIDQRKRLEERLKALADEHQKKLQEAAAQTRFVASETRATVFDVTQKAIFSLDDTIKRIEADLNRQNLDVLSPAAIEVMRRNWESELVSIEKKHREALTAARDMLASLAENLKAGSENQPAQLMEAMEERMLALEEQSDEDFEMVQLGLAVAIINHEFVAAIRNVRRSVQELGHISQSRQSLKPLYHSIRHNFQHLDGHLNLFTPLQRRLYRKPVEIHGASIRNYVKDLFHSRFDRHKVILETTDSFEKSQIQCYPSTLYPVFINLVDNAIYWLSTVKEERKIRVDANSKGYVISNTGTPIQDRDKDALFVRGFTRKPGGRGLGLFISKKALSEAGMDLLLAPPPTGFTTAFCISAPEIKLMP